MLKSEEATGLIYVGIDIYEVDYMYRPDTSRWRSDIDCFRAVQSRR